MIKKVNVAGPIKKIINPNKAKNINVKALCDEVFNPKPGIFEFKITNIVGLDCEMVEVEGGKDALARVSIVNYHGHILMDKFVIPEKRITDYRSWVSGVYPENLYPRFGAISY